MRKVSLFDLDQTLLKDNGSFQFGIYLYKHKAFSFASMLYYVICYALHKLNCMPMQRLHEKIFGSLFKGKSSSTFNQLAKEFLDQQFDSMCYPPAIQKLQEAKKSGHFTVILSSSPDFLVKLIANRLNVDAWAATSFLVDNNDNFWKISNVMHGECKSRYMHSLSKKLAISIGNFIAYSDSYLDLPFLKAAGRAVGVNPDKKLKSICKKNQWEII